MEKLIATCLLVVMMVGLSFGDNNINNNNLLSENNSANTEGVTNFIENPTESGIPSEAASLFLKYKVNGELDSFPLQKEAKNGTYNYEDNTQKVRLTVLDNMVTSFNINDVEMAKSDISKFEKLINKIITSDSKQNISERTNEGMLATTMPADRNGLYMNSDKAKLSVDDKGLHMNAVDDNGQSFNLSVDENGFKMNGVDENGQPIKMNIDKNGVNLNNDAKEEFQNNVVELRQEMKELRQDIKECDCTTNFDFRMALIQKIDGLLSKFNSSASQDIYNATELKFLKLKNEWERGECDDNKSSKGSKSGSDGGGTTINGYGNHSTVASTSPSYYSYGTGSSKADADNNKSDKAIRSLFRNLINGGYVSLNKQCRVEFDNKRLKVEGKTLDNATFTRIKNAFESQLGKKSTYSIAFNGFVKSISESDLEMEGSFSTSY